jgi:hypothetical protein
VPLGQTEFELMQLVVFQVSEDGHFLGKGAHWPEDDR